MTSERKPPVLPPAPNLYQLRAENRAAYFIKKTPAGTRQHDLFHPDFWRAHRAHLERHDILHVLVEGEDGEPEKWEIVLNVESTTPDVTVSLRQRIDRNPLSTDIVRLGNGDYVQWVAGAGSQSAYTVFKADGKPTAITGHKTVEAARIKWAQRQPKAA